MLFWKKPEADEISIVPVDSHAIPADKQHTKKINVCCISMTINCRAFVEIPTLYRLNLDLDSIHKMQ